MISLVLTGTTIFALLDDSDENDGVGHNDDEQGQKVDHDNAEHGVGRLPGLARERVEGDALCVPSKVWVHLHVKDVDLKHSKPR